MLVEKHFDERSEEVELRQNFSKVSPWVYLPCLEFTYGLIRNYTWLFITLIFKTLGASNTLVGLSAFLQAPLSFRALWAPAVERMGTYRQIVVVSLFLTAIAAGGIGVVLLLGISNLALISAVFFLLILIASGFDTAYMGYKMSVLTTKEIEFFTGVGNGFFRLGVMFGATLLVYLVGVVFAQTDSYTYAWGVILLGGAIMIFIGACYLKATLPVSRHDSGEREALTPKNYLKCYVSFITQPGGKLLTFYFLTAVMGEGILMGMKVPFFLDSAETGGVGMDLTALGILSPAVFLAMIASGVWGGFILRRFGLNNVFFKLGILMFVPNIVISLLALFPEYARTTYELTWLPGSTAVLYPWVLVAAVVEMIGYGLAFSCYKAFEALVSKNAGMHKGTYGAIIGSLNLMGLTFGTGISGLIQEAVGYFWVFNVSILISLPAWLIIPFMPVQDILNKSNELDAEERENDFE